MVSKRQDSSEESSNDEEMKRKKKTKETKISSSPTEVGGINQKKYERQEKFQNRFMNSFDKYVEILEKKLQEIILCCFTRFHLLFAFTIVHSNVYSDQINVLLHVLIPIT